VSGHEVMLVNLYKIADFEIPYIVTESCPPPSFGANLKMYNNLLHKKLTIG
jgi:hypothetical protein